MPTVPPSIDVDFPIERVFAILNDPVCLVERRDQAKPWVWA